MADCELNDEDRQNHIANLGVLSTILENSRYSRVDRQYFDALRDDDLAASLLSTALTPQDYDEFYQKYETHLWFEEADLMSKLSKEQFENRFVINGPQIGLRFKRVFSYIPNFALIKGGQVAVQAQCRSDKWARPEYLVFDVIDTSQITSDNLIKLSPVRGQQHYSQMQLRGMTIMRAYLIPCYALFDRCHETMQKLKDNETHVLRRVMTAVLSNNSESVLKNHDDSTPLIDIEGTNNEELLSRLNTLDEDQRTAVMDILAAKFRPYPYVISGVPGSGKTETLIEAILQVHERSDGTMRILVCATSDMYLQRLFDRIVSDGRISEDMIDSGNSDQTWRSSITAIDDKPIHLATTLKSGSFADNYFDYVFFDKATGAHQPETLIAWCKLKTSGCFVMAGDILQEYTRLQNGRIRAIGKDESMLQLFSQNAHTAERDPRYTTYLVRSYRSDPRIMCWANQERYSGRIVLGNLKTPRYLLHQLGFSSPVVLVDVCELNRSGDIRVQTQLLAQTCLTHLVKLNESQIGPNEIGVVAMTTRIYLRDQLRRHLRRDYNERIVNSDNEFLGVEKKAIVIVLDPSRKGDQSRTKYIFGGRRRLAMAMTRAKWIVIIIGDFTELSDNSTWQELSKSSCNITLGTHHAS